MSSARRARVEHALRDVLQSAIATDVKDPRVRAATLITVGKVELNVDMSVARVYVSVTGAEPSAVIAGLSKAASFLRGPIARELNLQRAPELRFLHDVSIDMSEKLAAIIREDEERARAAGRIAGRAEPQTSEPATDATTDATIDAQTDAQTDTRTDAQIDATPVSGGAEPRRDEKGST